MLKFPQLSQKCLYIPGLFESGKEGSYIALSHVSLKILTLWHFFFSSPYLSLYYLFVEGTGYLSHKISHNLDLTDCNFHLWRVIKHYPLFQILTAIRYRGLIRFKPTLKKNHTS